MSGIRVSSPGLSAAQRAWVADAIASAEDGIITPTGEYSPHPSGAGISISAPSRVRVEGVAFDVEQDHAGHLVRTGESSAGGSHVDVSVVADKWGAFIVIAGCAIGPPLEAHAHDAISVGLIFEPMAFDSEALALAAVEETLPSFTGVMSVFADHNWYAMPVGHILVKAKAGENNWVGTNGLALDTENPDAPESVVYEVYPASTVDLPEPLQTMTEAALDALDAATDAQEALWGQPLDSEPTFTFQPGDHTKVEYVGRYISIGGEEAEHRIVNCEAGAENDIGEEINTDAGKWGLYRVRGDYVDDAPSLAVRIVLQDDSSQFDTEAEAEAAILAHVADETENPTMGYIIIHADEEFVPGTSSWDPGDGDVLSSGFYLVEPTVPRKIGALINHVGQIQHGAEAPTVDETPAIDTGHFGFSEAQANSITANLAAIISALVDAGIMAEP